MDIGFNNPSKQQDSIYSDHFDSVARGAYNDSLMIDTVSLLPNKATVNTDTFTQMT